MHSLTVHPIAMKFGTYILYRLDLGDENRLHFVVKKGNYMCSNNEFEIYSWNRNFVHNRATSLVLNLKCR